MISHAEFAYRPNDSEREKASSGYLMSLIAIVIGMPFPFANLIATGIFYAGNRRGSYFTRWHCTQALLSQITIFFFNAAAVGWTIYIFFGSGDFQNSYFAYLFLAVLVNLIEFVMTIYSAVVTRKGHHVEWWFWGPLTHILCKE